MHSLIVVSGTGTSIGKTHVSATLLRGLAGGRRTLGLKPVETGVTSGLGADATVLREASTFHVTPCPQPYAFPDPVSPHLAARRVHRIISLEPILETVAKALPNVDLLLLELAGGLFSPLAPTLLNIDLVRALPPSHLVLVAPDRLGVLHDVLATLAAARSLAVTPSALVLSPPLVPDSSTTLNAPELALLTQVPCFAIPRMSSEALCSHPSFTPLLALLLESTRDDPGPLANALPPPPTQTPCRA